MTRPFFKFLWVGRGEDLASDLQAHAAPRRSR